jgi:hypothetical protein
MIGGKFCVKRWVKIKNLLRVGKSHYISTFQPTIFKQLFSTHQPQLIIDFFTVSTGLITIIKLNKEEIFL